MKKSKPVFNGRFIFRYAIASLMLYLITFPDALGTGNEVIIFNRDYKLKRISGTTVSVYQTGESGKKVEYTFNNFNADLLLLVYRNMAIDQIATSLTKKYKLDRTECRRQLKVSLNTLEEWDIISRSK